MYDLSVCACACTRMAVYMVVCSMCSVYAHACLCIWGLGAHIIAENREE